MRRRAVLGALAVGVAAGTVPARLRAADVLRIGNVPIDSSSEIYAAIAQGFLAKVGIEPQVQSFSNGSAITAGVVGGSLDLGSINTLSMADAYARGVKIRFVDTGSIYTTTNPTTVMLVAKDSPLRGAADLAGKTIAINVLQGISHVSAQAWIDKNGGASKSVKFVELPFPAMPAALQAGRVDAAVVAEPAITVSREVTRVFSKCYDGIGPRWAIDGYMATDAWIAAHPDVAHRFLIAMRQAAKWANDNHDKTAVIVSEAMKVPLDVVRQMRRATFLERADLSVVQPVIDVGAQYGALKSAFPAAELFIPEALQ